MDRGIIGRLVVVLAAVLAALWMLTPTIGGAQMQEQLDAYAKAVKVAEETDEPIPEFPWWVKVLPNKSIALGLDLQGGLDLSMQVDVDEAVITTVQRDVSSVKSAAEIENVAIADVRRERREPRLMISPGPGVDIDTIRAFMSRRFNGYTYYASKTMDGADWYLFELTADARALLITHAVQQARETIENRINETGVKEPSITIKGSDTISIQLPGETNPADAIQTVGTTARLEFQLVDEEADPSEVSRMIEDARAAMPPEEFEKDKYLSDWLSDAGRLPPKRVLRWEYEKIPGERLERRSRPFVLKDEILLTGDDVNDAQSANNGQTGEWYVALEFKPSGQKIFADVTGENVGKRFAIMLDDHVKSAPVIQERINGTASIRMGSGNVDQQIKDAGQLALWLRSGALPAPVQPGEVRTVGASLGAQAIDEGLTGVAVGGLLVLLVTAFYYRLSGILADFALAINVLLVLALLAALGATLTLPGICGIALTVGMAVDCNIIVFERIREELRAGRNARGAVEAGFARAFVAVFDSNVTTLLAGVVLYSYGTGPLKGFAVTLMIGIFTTLFTGVFVSRALTDAAMAIRRSDTLSI